MPRLLWLVWLLAPIGVGCGTPPADEGSETSTEETSATTETGETGDTGSGSECNLYDQDCPEGEKCTWVWIDNASSTRCVPSDGAVPIGEPCHHDGAGVGTDDCASGICYGPLSVTTSWDGVCTPFCGGTPDDPLCEPPTICTLGNISVCLTQCDPLVQDCPGANETCWHTPGANVFVCSIASATSNTAEPCITSQDCVEGLTCVEGATVAGCTDPGCCTSFCDLTQPNTCPGAADGEECVDLMVGGAYANVGVCQIPQ